MQPVGIFCFLNPLMGNEGLIFKMGNTGAGIIPEGGIDIVPCAFFGNKQAGNGHEDEYRTCDKGGENSHLYMKFAKHRHLLFEYDGCILTGSV